MKEFQLFEKTKLQQQSQIKKHPLSSLNNTKQEEIQALNELIDNVNIDEDTNFMDLSHWIMNINNEMLTKD